MVVLLLLFVVSVLIFLSRTDSPSTRQKVSRQNPGADETRTFDLCFRTVLWHCPRLFVRCADDVRMICLDARPPAHPPARLTFRMRAEPPHLQTPPRQFFFPQVSPLEVAQRFRGGRLVLYIPGSFLEGKTSARTHSVSSRAPRALLADISGPRVRQTAQKFSKRKPLRHQCQCRFPR